MKNILGSAPFPNAVSPVVQGPAKNTAPSSQAQHYEERATMPSGANPAPTKGPLQSRSASPPNTNTSGMERAMGAHADKLHPVGKRK